jgi:hypothetical protein
MSGNVRFVRIRGRVVPMRASNGTPGASDIAGSIARGTAAGGAVYGAVKGAQYVAFKRGTRLQGISDFYRKWPAPTMGLTQVAKGKGFTMLGPDMFQKAAFHKAEGVAQRMWARAPKWNTMAQNMKGMARTLGKYAVPAAVVAGLGVGIASFMRRGSDKNRLGAQP